jgi:hypothetical protein
MGLSVLKLKKSAPTALHVDLILEMCSSSFFLYSPLCFSLTLVISGWWVYMSTNLTSPASLISASSGAIK